MYFGVVFAVPNQDFSKGYLPLSDVSGAEGGVFCHE